MEWHIITGPMAQNTVTFRILVASPSDVERERRTLVNVINRWNAAHSISAGIMLEAVRWETHAYPETGDYPQGIINRQIVDKSDIVVGVFWSRLGSPTPKAPSGTVEEIERLRARGKRILLYFSLADLPQDHNRRQFALLQKYKRKLRKDTLYWTFKTSETLDQLFSQHLAKVMSDLAEKNEERTPAPGKYTKRNVGIPTRDLLERFTGKRVLLIEDDRDIIELVRHNLEREGFRVEFTTDGSRGLAILRKAPPDILILDWMLPKLSGLEICKEIRHDKTLNRLPILMLTARAEEIDRVVGLEMGADDYITKPFSPRELGARVMALLRRAGKPREMPSVVVERGLTIDPSLYRVTLNGKHVPMSTLEFRLLYSLAVRPNFVFTRDQLLDAVWGTDRFVTPRSVDVYIRRLREKIEKDLDHPSFLKTVRGAGWVFESAKNH